MKLWSRAVVSTFIALATVTAQTAVAHAEPDSDGAAGKPSCAFSLTPPTVVDTSGTKMVTATLEPGECTGNITVNSWTVCVGLKDGGAKPRCAFHPWWDRVQVYFTPYRPGAVYESTGRACGNVAPMMDLSCTSLGPYRSTL